jgi:uncharacterized metal-binding protein
MPAYNIHRLFNYAIFIAIVLFLYSGNILNFGPWHLIAITSGFYIGTEFVTPDLDTDSAAFKRWGKLKILMLPYKWIFKHRQSSHNIIYGAIVRVLYITVIILGFYYLIFKSLPYDMMLPSVFVIIFLSGIIAANALHVILDSMI